MHGSVFEAPKWEVLEGPMSKELVASNASALVTQKGFGSVLKDPKPYKVAFSLESPVYKSQTFDFVNVM